MSDLMNHVPIHSIGSEPGDHDLFSHFVELADAVDSYNNGTAIASLCGKIWVPSRDAQGFPMCPTCLEILGSMSGETIR